MIKRRGFTIIEVLVVVSIIILLLSVIMVSLGEAKFRARDARRVAEMAEMYKEAMLVHAEPATPFSGCGASHVATNTCTNPDLSKFRDPAKPDLTCNSSSVKACDYSVAGANGNAIQGVLGVINVPNTQDFEICSYLEGGAGSLSKGLVSVGSASGGVIVRGCK